MRFFSGTEDDDLINAKLKQKFQILKGLPTPSMVRIPLARVPVRECGHSYNDHQRCEGSSHSLPHSSGL
jgi:hypothetical protein